MTHESFHDLRHECAKEAASYLNSDPGARDGLLGRLRAHFRAVVHEFLREFPDAAAVA